MTYVSNSDYTTCIFTDKNVENREKDFKKLREMIEEEAIHE